MPLTSQNAHEGDVFVHRIHSIGPLICADLP
jgi:hypothetical protein